MTVRSNGDPSNKRLIQAARATQRPAEMIAGRWPFSAKLADGYFLPRARCRRKKSLRMFPHGFARTPEVNCVW